MSNKNVKATFKVCEGCDQCSFVRRPGGRSEVHCLINRKTLVRYGEIVGVLKEVGKDKPVRFSNAGPWHVPTNCPYYTEQLFLQIERSEQQKERDKAAAKK